MGLRDTRQLQTAALLQNAAIDLFLVYHFGPHWVCSSPDLVQSHVLNGGLSKLSMPTRDLDALV